MFRCQQCSYTTDRKSNLTRHLQRKRGCKALNVITEATDVITEALNVITEATDVIPGKVRCTNCTKELLRKSLNKHLTTCKGAPLNTCPKCKQIFNHRSNLSRHKKTCNYTEPPQMEPQPTVFIQNNNHNNTVNNFIIQNQFGKEDFSFILDKLCEDPRLTRVATDFKDAIALVHFNRDFPENQTVRKMNKRSNTIELLSSTEPERWEMEPFDQGFAKVLSNIKSQLRLDINCDVPKTFIREHLYHLSKTQPLTSTTELLSKYPDNTKELYIDEVTAFCKDYIKNYNFQNREEPDKLLLTPMMRVDITKATEPLAGKYNIQWDWENDIRPVLRTVASEIRSSMLPT